MDTTYNALSVPPMFPLFRQLVLVDSNLPAVFPADTFAPHCHRNDLMSEAYPNDFDVWFSCSRRTNKVDQRCDEWVGSVVGGVLCDRQCWSPRQTH